MRIALIFLMLAGLCSGAITEKYVSVAGAGTKDGSTAGNAMSWAELKTAMQAGGAAAGDRYNLISGTYTLGASDTWTNDGTPASPIILRGYKTTIGDLDTQGRTGGNGSLNTTDFPVVDYSGGAYRFGASGSNNLIVENIKFTTAYSGAGVYLGAGAVIRRCDVRNSSTNAAAEALDLNGPVATAIDCDVYLTGATGGVGAIVGSTGARVLDCKVLDTQAAGIYTSASSCVFIGNTIVSAGTNAIYFAGAADASYPPLCYGNTIYAATVGYMAGNRNFTYSTIFVNNLVRDCTSYGRDSEYQGTDMLGMVASNNRLYNNGGGNRGFADWATATSWGDVTGAGDDFTNAGTGDFTLLTTSLAKAAGVIPYMDIGALQRQEPSASGTVHTGFNGGFDQ